MFIYIHIYLYGFTYYTCVYLRELIHELYHSDASLQPSHVVATIIIGQQPAIATIYSGTHIYIYVCVCVYCVLCPPYTTTLYCHRRTPLCRASNCKRSGRYNGGRVVAMKEGGGGDSDVRSALFCLLLFIFSHLTTTIS